MRIRHDLRKRWMRKLILPTKLLYENTWASNMIFEWDENKARDNLQKHNITFDEATTVFGDPLALTFKDVENSIEEDRFLTFGQSSAEKHLLISHTDS